MVEHTCKSNYSPFRIKLNLFVIIGAAITILGANAGYDPVKMIKGMLALFVIGQWHYILNIVDEMSRALKIRVFRVKEKVSIYHC